MAVQQEKPVALGLQVGWAGQPRGELRGAGEGTMPAVPTTVRVRPWIRSPECLALNPGLLPTGCVALGKLSLSEPQFPQRSGGDSSSSSVGFTGLIFNELSAPWHECSPRSR